MEPAALFAPRDRFSYFQPRWVDSPAECDFYQVMDLPGLGRVGGQWDLRPTVDEYLGRFDFSQKRVLDIGAASGFLTFEMERRGASVVSFDIGEGQDWDIAPFAEGLNHSYALSVKRDARERMLNGYWLAHRLLGSSARAFYGNIYDLPEELGLFDVVVMGSVLLHLRDPLRALCSASRLSKDAVIVTDVHLDSPRPVMEFLPDLEARNVDTWWRISEPCMASMLRMAGFGAPVISRCEHLMTQDHQPRPILLSTYVARRPPPPPTYRRASAREARALTAPR
jgi:SAM-dependent methyltransferase